MVLQSVNELDQFRGFVRAPQRESYTPTGDVLDTLLLEYRKQFGDRLSRTGVKKKVFIVITDGAACKSPFRLLRPDVGIEHLGIFLLLQTSRRPRRRNYQRSQVLSEKWFPR